MPWWWLRWIDLIVWDGEVYCVISGATKKCSTYSEMEEQLQDELTTDFMTHDRMQRLRSFS
jgi:hypothetical protein